MNVKISTPNQQTYANYQDAQNRDDLNCMRLIRVICTHGCAPNLKKAKNIVDKLVFAKGTVIVSLAGRFDNFVLELENSGFIIEGV